MKKYVCLDCQSDWRSKGNNEKPAACPKCKSKNVMRLADTPEE